MIFQKEKIRENSKKSKPVNLENKLRKEEALLERGDPGYFEIYEGGVQKCSMNGNLLRRSRFYNLIQFFRQILPLEGLVAECGSWRGLSSYLMCHYLKKDRPGFTGQGFHLFDSFQGLPAPTPEDDIPRERSSDIQSKFSAPLSEVKAALSEFPEITYHAGWIPQTLLLPPEFKFKFVHIDLDLYKPTREAVSYFYSRLVPRGILVCDDYASPGWAGAKKAVDDFCAQNGLAPLALSTGQAVLIRAYGPAEGCGV